MSCSKCLWDLGLDSEGAQLPCVLRWVSRGALETVMGPKTEEPEEIQAPSLQGAHCRPCRGRTKGACWGGGSRLAQDRGGQAQPSFLVRW